MKNCPFCQEKIAEEARFCVHCMKSLAEKETILLPTERFFLFRPKCLAFLSAFVVCALLSALLVFSGLNPLPGKTQENPAELPPSRWTRTAETQETQQTLTVTEEAVATPPQTQVTPPQTQVTPPTNQMTSPSPSQTGVLTKLVHTHLYDNACDSDCNVCNEKRVAPHAFSGTLDADCNLCGKEQFTYTYYVSEYGSDSSDGLSEFTPKHTVSSAMASIIKLNLKESDTVGILIEGTVFESGNYLGQRLLYASSTSIPAHIYIVGTTYDAEFVLPTSTQGSSTRRCSAYNITFRNLLFSASGPYEMGPITLAPNIGNLTFDDVTFNDDTVWAFHSVVSSAIMANKATELGATAENPICFHPTLTLMNGDYRNIAEISANYNPVYTFVTPGSLEKTEDEQPKPFTINSRMALDIKLVIGEGAKVNSVCGTYQAANSPKITIEVMPGAEVESIKGIPDGYTIDANNQINLIIHEGATVGNVQKTGADSSFSGTVKLIVEEKGKYYWQP